MPAMRLPLLLAALCAWPAAAGDPAPAAGRIVEQVVAVVRTPTSTQPRIITLTRLQEEARIALVSQGAMGAATAELDGPALQAGLEWLVDQILLLDEVARLQVFEVDRAEVLEELRRFQARFAAPSGYRDFLSRWDVTEEELLVVLRRTLRVQRYLDSRVSGAARVKEADVDRYLREHGGEPGADPAAARAAARARLVEERTRSEAQALLAELRSRATIRVLEPFGQRKG
jgi:hypothetical protein